MALNHFGVVEYSTFMTLCFFAIGVSVAVANRVGTQLTDEELGVLQERSGDLFGIFAFVATVGVPGTYWLLDWWAADFFNEHLHAIIVATFAMLTVFMLGALWQQVRACWDVVPNWYFAWIVPAKLLGVGGLIAMISLVVIETRPLPGERGAADCFPDYQRALTIALAERHPAESIRAVVQFGEGDLSVLSITIDGQPVSRDQPQFHAIAEEVLAVRVTSRLKRISRRVFVSA